MANLGQERLVIGRASEGGLYGGSFGEIKPNDNSWHIPTPVLKGKLGYSHFSAEPPCLPGGSPKNSRGLRSSYPQGRGPSQLLGKFFESYLRCLSLYLEYSRWVYAIFPGTHQVMESGHGLMRLERCDGPQR